MRKAALAIAALALSLSGVARADIGTVDAVPAATLLLPHFEVDLGNVGGRTTLMSINNASASAALVKVTLWTDLGIPTVSFPVYLTGYDVQTLNLRDILNGVLPQTASDGQDPLDSSSPTDGISNQGNFSQDINFATCNGVLPPAALSAPLAAELRAAHTGGASATLLGGKCGGRSLGDQVARGYVTVDSVTQCSNLNPSSAGYFTGVAASQNILWGDYFYVDPAQNFAQGDTLVHIEASATNPLTNTPGNYTFYGRHVAWTAADNREPLATNFATRFLNGGVFTGGTDLFVWRDSKSNPVSFNCGSSPTWYPLGAEQVVIFDEQENRYAEPDSGFFPAPLPLPASFAAMSARVAVGGPDLPVPFTFGWLYLNLNTVVSGNPNPPADPAAAQAWVTAAHKAEGRFSVGYGAVTLDSATAASHMMIPEL